MKKLKILHLIYFPGSGGTEEYIYLLASELQKRGHPVFLVYSEEGPLVQRLKAQNIKTEQIKMRHPFDFLAVFNLFKFLKKEKIDVCHTHFLRENFIAILAGKLANIPVIWTVHRQDPQKPLVKFFNRLMTKLNYKIIAVSGSVKNYLINLGISNSKIEIIYNGVLVPKVIEQINKEFLKIPGNHLVIGLIGRFVKEKGFDILIKAADLLKEKPISFVVVGDGPEKESLKLMVENLNLKNVYFPGLQKANNIFPLFDIFVLPSRAEAMPLALLEAMAYQLPVIASNVGGITEIVKDRKNGLIFEKENTKDLTNKINYLLKNKSLREKLAEEAKKTIQKEFDLKKMVAKILNLYLKATK